MPENTPSSIFMLVPLDSDTEQYQAAERYLHSRWPMATIAYPWVTLRRAASDKLNLQADIEIISGYTDLVVSFPGWTDSAYMRAVASLAVALGIAARDYNSIVGSGLRASDDKGDSADTVPEAPGFKQLCSCIGVYSDQCTGECNREAEPAAEIRSTHLIGPGHPEYLHGSLHPERRLDLIGEAGPERIKIDKEADWEPADRVAIHHDIDTTTTTMIIITRTESR